MLQRKRIAQFAVLFVLSYGVLMGVRSWVGDAYAAWFRAFGNAVFTRFWVWGDGSVWFLDLESPDWKQRLEAKYRRRIALPMRQETERRLVTTLGRLPSREEVERQHEKNMNDALGQVRRKYAAERAVGVKDTLMILWNDASPASFGGLKTSSRMMGYAPTVMILALFLATPTTWRRRLGGLVWGLLLVHLFIAVRLSLTIAAEGYALDKEYALFHPSEFWLGALARAEEIVVQNPTAYLAICVVIWLLICFVNASLSPFRPAAESNARRRHSDKGPRKR